MKSIDIHRKQEHFAEANNFLKPHLLILHSWMVWIYFWFEMQRNVQQKENWTKFADIQHKSVDGELTSMFFSILRYWKNDPVLHYHWHDFHPAKLVNSGWQTDPPDQKAWSTEQSKSLDSHILDKYICFHMLKLLIQSVYEARIQGRSRHPSCESKQRL